LGFEAVDRLAEVVLADDGTSAAPSMLPGAVAAQRQGQMLNLRRQK
jgi:hypothetical protein